MENPGICIADNDNNPISGPVPLSDLYIHTGKVKDVDNEYSTSDVTHDDTDTEDGTEDDNDMNERVITVHNYIGTR